jgi:tripartite-type tricarboxylate transporter receptor subunit TctC
VKNIKKKIKKAVLFLAAVCLVFTILAAGFASDAADSPADKWPEKNVTMVVPFAPGGVTDIITRLIAQNLAEQWGVQVIVENMPGGSSLTGIANVIRRPPDGYSMVSCSSAILVTRYTTDVFIPLNDYTPLCKLVDTFITLTIRKDLPYANINEFVAAAKEKQGGFTMAVSGTKSAWFALAEEFARTVGIKFTYIPYDGGAPAAAAVAGGHVDACMIDVATILPLLESGDLKTIGFFAHERNPRLPDAQTAIEAGYEGLILSMPTGILLPNGVDRAIMDKISLSVKAALETPEMKEFLSESCAGTENGYAGPDEFLAYMQTLDGKYKEFFSAEK